MTPVLYSETAQTFTNLGIGALNDTISCIVTESRNGAFELVLKYPQTGPLFSDIKVSRIIKAVPAYAKDPEPFRIYKITKPINGVITVYAEHISYQLSFIPVTAYTATTAAAALAGLKGPTDGGHAVEDHAFTFWTDVTKNGTFRTTTPASARSLLGGTAGSVLDVYGGEYEFIGHTVKLHASRGQDRGVTLRYGKNITDLKQDENIANTVTGVCPYWANDDGDVVTIPESEGGPCIYSAKVDRFPFKRTIVKDYSMSFDEKPTPAQLKAKAQQDMAKSGVGEPDVSITVKFVVLQQMTEYKDYAFLESVNICDTVNVEFESLGITAKAKVVTTKWNTLAEMYESISLGTVKTNLSKALTEISSTAEEASEEAKSAKSGVQTAVDEATKQITGANGGYVVLHQDGNGQPDEILIMDTADKDTAVNVWRWNKNGLGHSHSGYNGPFNDVAITQDGKIVADMITAGTIKGIKIEGNTLEGNSGSIGGWEISNNYLSNYALWESDHKIRKAYLAEPTSANSWVYSVQEGAEEGENPSQLWYKFVVFGDGRTYWGSQGSRFLTIDPDNKTIFIFNDDKTRVSIDTDGTMKWLDDEGIVKTYIDNDRIRGNIVANELKFWRDSLHAFQFEYKESNKQIDVYINDRKVGYIQVT